MLVPPGIWTLFCFSTRLISACSYCNSHGVEVAAWVLTALGLIASVNLHY